MFLSFLSAQFEAAALQHENKPAFSCSHVRRLCLDLSSFFWYFAASDATRSTAFLAGRRLESVRAVTAWHSPINDPGKVQHFAWVLVPCTVWLALSFFVCWLLTTCRNEGMGDVAVSGRHFGTRKCDVFQHLQEQARLWDEHCPSGELLL